MMTSVRIIMGTGVAMAMDMGMGMGTGTGMGIGMNMNMNMEKSHVQTRSAAGGWMRWMRHVCAKLCSACLRSSPNPSTLTL